MSDEVRVPFKFEGAPAARLAIEQVEGSLSSLERRVLSLAQADAVQKAALDALDAEFAEGKVTVEQYRASLVAMTSTAVRAASETRRAAEAHRASNEAMRASQVSAARAAEAFERTSRAEAAKALTLDLPDLPQNFLGDGLLGAITAPAETARAALRATGTAATEMAVEFGQVAAVVGTAAGALGGIAAVADAAATRVTNLASEGGRLTANADRLGLDFDRAADAAGRFTDETETMGAASRLAEADIRLTQEQLDALSRVAGSFAANTGTTTAGAIDTLAQGLISGSERGLRPFGGALHDVAGESHTVEERLAALTAQASRTTLAADDAASSYARFKDGIEDAERAAAVGVMEGLGVSLRNSQSAADALAASERGVSEASRDAAVNARAFGESMHTATSGVRQSTSTAQEFGQAMGWALGSSAQGAHALLDVVKLIPAALQSADEMDMGLLRGAMHDLEASAARFRASLDPNAAPPRAANDNFAPMAAGEAGLSDTVSALGADLLGRASSTARLLAGGRAGLEQQFSGAAARAAEIESKQRQSETAAKRASRAGGAGDPLAQLRTAIALSRELSAQERADLERELAVRARGLELDRLRASTSADALRVAVALRDTQALAADEERAVDEAQIARQRDLITLLERREATASHRLRATIHHEIVGLQEQEIALTRRMEDASHALALADATRYAAERDAMRQVVERERIEAAAEARRRAAFAAPTSQREQVLGRAETLDEQLARARENDAALNAARRAVGREDRATAQNNELAGVRDPAEQAFAIEEMRRAHTIERERDHLRQRYELNRDYTDRMEELHGSQFNSALALSEGVTGAFNSMGDAVANHIVLLAQDKEGFADAAQSIASETLASVSKQAVVKGAFEFAEGAAALAGVVTAPLAPGHFIAGAAYMGVAAAAGVGAAALAPSKPSVPSAAPRAESLDRPLGLGGSAANDNSRSAGTVYNINFNSQLYGLGGAREAARTVVRTINRGGLQGGVQLAPGALQATGSGS